MTIWHCPECGRPTRLKLQGRGPHSRNRKDALATCREGQHREAPKGAPRKVYKKDKWQWND